jgi:uncharacterized protein (TIGR02145 family)
VTACFTITPASGTTQQVFEFSAACSEIPNLNDEVHRYFCWNFGDADYIEIPSTNHISHQYAFPGEYSVSLKVVIQDQHSTIAQGWFSETVTVYDDSGNESPNAAFTVTPQQGTTATTFIFDASFSSDDETPVEQLEVRWDWTNDGTFDTEFTFTKEAPHRFAEAGTFTVTLEVLDMDDKTDQTSKEVQVSMTAPPVASFTIDPFEGNTLTVFTFDASGSSDLETPPENLLVAWDFENDGIWDTELASEKIAHHQYPAEGQYEIKLRVQDPDQLEDDEVKYLDVINCINGGEPCQGIPVVNYEGKIYNTVQIGDQCWFRENLNVGTRINSDVMQTNDQQIEKYCYDNLESNCDTYGGLYQWDEMMDYSGESGARGICPEGWHIPTDSDFDVLAQALGGYAIAGSKMKACSDWFIVEYLINTNESGFTGLPAGRWSQFQHQYMSLYQEAGFWTSDHDSHGGRYRYLIAGENDLDGAEQGVWSYKDSGMSVRCIKN